MGLGWKVSLVGDGGPTVVEDAEGLIGETGR